MTRAPSRKGACQVPDLLDRSDPVPAPGYLGAHLPDPPVSCSLNLPAAS
jgi:hypothetical protein